jgi:intein/homing endonuclease
MKLVRFGILEVTLKTNKSIFYKLKDIEKAKRFLEIYNVKIDKTKPLFDSIVGYNEHKEILKRVIQNDKPMHILLLGSPASVTGDKEIIVKTDNGIESIPIKDLYDMFKKGKRFLALSVNPKTLKAEWKDVTDVIYHGKREVVEIKLIGNRTVKVTKDHSLFQITKDGILIPIKASELKVNDYIPIVYRFQTNNNKGNEKDFKIGFAVGLWLADGSIQLESKYDKFVEVTNWNKAWLNEFRKGIKLIDNSYNPYKREIKKNYVRTYKKKIVDYFSQFIDKNYWKIKQKGRTATSKFLPPWIFNQSIEFKRGLIKGFFSGDANKKEPYFTIKNRKLRDGILLILMEFGIPSTIRTVKHLNKEYYELRIPKSFQNKFSEIFELNYKTDKTQHDEIFKIVFYQNGIHFHDKTIGINKAKEINDYLEKILNSDLLFSKIISIEEKGFEDVYDLSVKDNENFVTNDGILLHNTAKTLFLLELTKIPNSIYVTPYITFSGLFDYLDTEPPLLLIDQIDNIKYSDVYRLLIDLCEYGIITKTSYNEKISKIVKTKVIATANSIKRIPQALLSRFLILQFKKYSEEEFINISKTLLKDYNITEDVKDYIIEKCKNSLDVRNVLKLANIVKTKEDVDKFMKFIRFLA